MSTPCYIIGGIRIDDLAAYEEYKLGVPALVARHGGEYLVRGGDPELGEGNWQPSRVVMIRFPSRAAAHAFHDDPDYAGLKALRQRIAGTDLVFVDGTM
jgi:uncharacterized protein (DUF1330 family)